ncbi:MAG TPA: AMP-binding protein [Alphaproteobacteria bacterium]|nr:AMP-binding protein [Alphaproteobacteria bacterium]
MRLLKPGLSLTELRAFRLEVPARFNIGTACCDAHAGGTDKLALIYEGPEGRPERFTYARLQGLSNRLANALGALGIARGDRVGILLGQRPETALSHLTLYRMGAIALPLFTLFGPDALEYRLANSGAKALVTDAANLPKLAKIRERLPELAHVIVIDSASGDGADHAFWSLIERAAGGFRPVDTAGDEPALLIYTSGTTGPPKGTLHAHRGLWGHLPSIEFTHDFFPQAGDLFWTPADWAWGGGLLDVLLPSLLYGVPVLAHRFAKFDPEEAFALMARHEVRNAFLPPTALKMMRQVEDPAARHAFAMRSIASGGEALGTELVEWCQRTFGLLVNEFWGQTEVNLLTGNCGVLGLHKPGSLGIAAPGHHVAVLDEDGNEVPPGTSGELAARGPHPVFILEYWGNPEATAEKFRDGWAHTGDVGRMDEDGFFWFEGRSDDLISSGAYRIGPSEIEDCLIKHPAVAMAAAIGAPDPVRGEIVKAFVVLKPGEAASPDLTKSLQAHVRKRLSAHQYPRALEFVAELPMTATGKIRRRDLREQEIARQKQQQQ